jgi:chromosome segregation ATPase
LKYKNLAEKINAILEEAERANELVKKRTESIAELKKQIKKLSDDIKDIKDKNNREHYFVRENLIEFRNEIREVVLLKKELQGKFDDLVEGFNPQYNKFKQKLNDHYYVLQKAFNDYIKGIQPGQDKISLLESSIKQMKKRLDEQDQKMVELFFNGDQKA